MTAIGENFKAALLGIGPIGQRAVAQLENQSRAMREQFAMRAKAERQVRDMALEIERLKRELAEARSKP